MESPSNSEYNSWIVGGTRIVTKRPINVELYAGPRYRSLQD